MSQRGKLQQALSRGRNRDSESWIYSYADLITNLLAIFIMILVLNSGRTKASSSPTDASLQISSQDRERVQEFVTRLNLSQASSVDGAAVAPAPDRLEVLSDDQGLRVSFGGELLFPSGSSVLRPESLAILESISGVLQTLPSHAVIDVEGHSDATPTRSGRYPSNWELSSARAGSVVRALEDFGFPSHRMRAIGFADTKPVGSPSDLAANRRVVLRVRVQEDGVP